MIQDREHSEQFAEQLFDQQDLLTRQALKLTRDYHRAQDLVLETIARAWRSGDGFDGKNLSAWALRIQYNLWIDEKRRHPDSSVAVSLDDPNHEWSSEAERTNSDPSSEQEAIAQIGYDSIVHTIDTLPSRLGSVARLAFINEKPYPAIAESLGIPMGTVSSRVSRSREQLRRKLRESKPLGRK